MPDETAKLTPAEFLAELKAKGAGARTDAPSPPTGIEELDLDFSDLDGNREPPSRTDSNGSHDESAKEEAADSTSSSQNGAASHKKKPKDPKKSSGKTSEKAAPTPEAVRTNAHLSDLFERVNKLLGESNANPDEPFRPRAPQALEETGLTFEEVERIILKYLFSKGSATGRQVAAQVKLPFGIVDPILKQLKQDQLVAFKGAAAMGDYDFVITEHGRDRARRYLEECTYFGAAPVSLRDYLEAMAAQSIAKQHATEEDLKKAFSDLIMNKSMLEKLGPAINSGRGMFLYGEAGNGKTSIAERITRSFGTSIWIPRTLGIDGDVIRLYDPGVHEEIKQQNTGGLFDLSGIDQRWVQIVRPTVIAGGELTMAELEITQNPQTKICEAPLQLKSNCGTLVIDDFGRQRMPVDELLNRWIVPLEKRYDFLNLPSGKKIQVPFDQLIIFSTNLEPKDLVDGAFLRRIPYKIEAMDPTYEEFHALFEMMAPNLGFQYDKAAVDYLIDTHYKPCDRPFRACQPRDLLQQVKNFCIYKGLPKKLSPEGFDFAVANYFSVM